MNRSSKPETRNPMLKLAGLERLHALPADSKAALRDALLALRADAQVQATTCWKRHKAPMALYWKCVAVYAGHIARMLRN